MAKCGVGKAPKKTTRIHAKENAKDEGKEGKFKCGGKLKKK